MEMLQAGEWLLGVQAVGERLPDIGTPINGSVWWPGGIVY
jgi:hypothetical protein